MRRSTIYRNGEVMKKYSGKIVTEVYDILDMWKVIESDYGNLSAEEQSRVRPAGEPKFKGFDANNEKHFYIAKDLIERQGKYLWFRGRYINSHSPSIAAHRRMLETYQTIESRPLSASDIIAVLRARIHPENRVIP